MGSRRAQGALPGALRSPDHAALYKVLVQRQIDAVGHRVVHGGERFGDPLLIDNEITRAIERLNSLAPLHNPANVLDIRAIAEKWPEIPQVAVFGRGMSTPPSSESSW